MSPYALPLTMAKLLAEMVDDRAPGEEVGSLPIVPELPEVTHEMAPDNYENSYGEPSPGE